MHGRVQEALDARIFELEARAADSEMIASLAADEETRLCNRCLARQLRDHAGRLRRRRDAERMARN